MKLLNRKPVFNIYELFSDLIFCALVLFLFLILVLALNVNQKVEKFSTQEARIVEEARRTRDQLKSELASIRTQLSELEAEKAGFENLKTTTLAKQRSAFLTAVGPNRRIGSDGDTEILFSRFGSNHQKFTFLPKQAVSSFGDKALGAKKERLDRV